MFEGLPKMWRELLEMAPQAHEIDKIDESLVIRNGRIKRNNRVVYEVSHVNMETGSFKITATNKTHKRDIREN